MRSRPELDLCYTIPKRFFALLTATARLVAHAVAPAWVWHCGWARRAFEPSVLGGGLARRSSREYGRVLNHQDVLATC